MLEKLEINKIYNSKKDEVNKSEVTDLKKMYSHESLVSAQEKMQENFNLYNAKVANFF